MTNLRQPDVVTIAVTRVDGGLTILRVITAEYRPTTDAEQSAGLGDRLVTNTHDPTPAYITALIAKHGWTGGQQMVSWRFVPNDFVDDTTDRTFRNAWKDDGGITPGTDMPTARDIHRDRLRAIREPLLLALDADYLRALETNDVLEQRRIAAKKQALRDVTADPAIDAAQTPEALKLVMPAALVSTP